MVQHPLVPMEVMLRSVAAQEISGHLLMHLRATEFLASWCWSNNVLAFKMRPKHHYLWHIAMDLPSCRVNPNLYHCWEEENFLGSLKKIATKCHGRTVQKRCLERYVLGLASFMNKLA